MFTSDRESAGKKIKFWPSVLESGFNIQDSGRVVGYFMPLDAEFRSLHHLQGPSACSGQRPRARRMKVVETEGMAA